MTSIEIRRQFLDFFKSKEHEIYASAPMVVKDDPTLMFTNAGMNQFKDIFLGNKPVVFPRIANTQKCLRVSGKHNDLEEVGHDTYHHTMFEMLGNWSFGNYFKKEAIEWAWELLTDVYKLDKNRLYVTVFGGDKGDNMEADNEAKEYWKSKIDESRILYGSKKDNFWEMGDQGPCGPCSEIHIDLRDEAERAKIAGKDLVNNDHPQVVEIWNLVFIQFNRKADGSLEQLAAKHVDTGMGFERLCMALQGKKSNYDTDVFQPLIQRIAGMAGKVYGKNEKEDIAMRVIADHSRAIAFAIADGQLPSNNKAGYVIRRILRRAVRYGYTFMGFEKPFIYALVGLLAKQMGEFFPELVKQRELIEKVIMEEEHSFLRTLANGLNLLNKIMENLRAENKTEVNGAEAFELYDTYGFPFDLTELILRENGLTVNKAEFDREMEKQKSRSRSDAATDKSDWIELLKDDKEEFIGYDHLTSKVKITRYRKVTAKGKDTYQLVFNITPFYAESGGQVGDTGYIESANEKIFITDTKKENNLIIHTAEQLPEHPTTFFTAVVDAGRRARIATNHTATHLMHYALRQVLGTHVEQKGSLVSDSHLRFDFAHFQKMTEEEILKVETLVNSLIRSNFTGEILKDVPIEEAQEMGAMALFGEKYGDVVRVVKFGDSVELCGGTHLTASGNIGIFKITGESAIAAGVRRIEAITADAAEHFFRSQLDLIAELKLLVKNPNDVVKGVKNIIEQNLELQKKLESFGEILIQHQKENLLKQIQHISGINFLALRLEMDMESMKKLCFSLNKSVENLLVVFASEADGKANLVVSVSENLLKEKGLNASNIVRELAKEINGGGGGQPTMATAGGKKPEGIEAALKAAEKFVV